MIRTAIITSGESGRVAQYLPANYSVVAYDDDTTTIQGTDNAGWTLDDYVLPRLASGLLFGIEVVDLPVIGPEEGVTRCGCGSKYWDGDRCHSCGEQWFPHADDWDDEAIANEAWSQVRGD